MSGGSRKRGLDAGDTEKTKMRKEDRQVLLDCFDCIDDVILELRSMEGYVGHEKFDGFRKILEKLEQWAILGRRRQEQDASKSDQRIIYMDEITELRRLVDQHVGMSTRAEFEEQLKKMESEDRRVIKQMNQRENLNHVFETVDSSKSYAPLQQDMFLSQPDEQSIEVVQVIKSQPDVPNLIADGGGFLSSSADLEEPHENDVPLLIETNTVLDRSPRGYGDMWSTSEESIASNDQTSTWDEVSYRESKIVDNPRPHVPFKKDLHHSQVNEEDPAPMTTATMVTAFLRRMIKGCGELGSAPEESSALERQSNTWDEAVDQSTATITEEKLVVVLKPDTPNISNQLHKVAQINFSAELLKTFHQFCHEWGNTNDVKEMCDMINQRTILLEDAQYTYSRAGQQQFSLKLLTKLRSFEQNAAHKFGTTFGSPNLNMVFEKLVEKIQPDAQSYAQFLLPKSKYMSDLDLLKCIASDSNSDAAQHILRTRKLRLTDLSFLLCRGSEMFEGRVKLYLDGSELGDPLFGINHSKYRSFKYETDVNKESTVHLFKIIMQFYDVSQASITLRRYGSPRGMNYQLLKSTFGPPPTDQNDKIRIKEIILECSGWDSEVFIHEHSLTSGVEVIEFRKIIADPLMEKCTASVVILTNSKWSKESIFSVLTAHRLSGDKCYPRNIRYQCRQNGDGSSTVKDWEELFELWSRAFEALHGNIGRRVTMRTVRDNNCDYVALTLH